jgi:predicted NACHT family NTPase
VPIFVTLKDLDDRQKHPSFLEYITEIYAANQSDSEKAQFMMNLEKLMNCGRVMILLDGLDEVTDTSQEQILNQIREITESFHQNQFVMSCRMAVQKYTFENFIEIQVADLEYKQIITVANKWFNSNNQMVDIFIKNLQENVKIQEFATNPLLLNLLCLVFESTEKFPKNHLDLYQQGLEILLQQWDETKTRDNDIFYRNIQLVDKQKLLDSLALRLFEKGEFFVKKDNLVKYILEFLNKGEEKPLFFIEKESNWILTSIENQHKVLVERTPGIYSFYHSNLQHYLTARAIVNSRNSQDLLILVNSLTKPAWREVFLLASQMMPNSDELLILMKKKIDQLMASDEKLQQFLHWTHQKALSVPVGFKPAAVRAFYLALLPT